MLTFTLRELRARTRRLVGAGTAVVLGVAFLFATLTVSDTLRSGFDRIFTDANAGVDLVVRDATVIGSEERRQRGTVDEVLADHLRNVPGVASVVPTYEGTAQIVGSDGSTIGGDGPPTTGRNWIDDRAIDAWVVAEGREPSWRADGVVEVVIDRASAAAGSLAVGNVTTVLAPGPVEVEVVGVATFGELDSMGPTTFVAFAPETAHELLVGEHGRASSFLVAAGAGVSADQLRSVVASTLPPGVEAITGAERTAEQLADIESDFLGFVEVFLVAFAAVALLVAAISIGNTFSILVAQRTRESALLRTLGASRAQVLGSTVGESFLVGAVASLIGLGAGYGLGLALRALMASAGIDLPGSGLVVTGSAVVIALATGLLVTVAASTVPAVRAARVSPLAALRDAAVESNSTSRVRAGLGAAAAVVGTVMLFTATREADGAVLRAGVASLVLVVACLLAAPVLTRPVMSVMAAPLGRVRGTSGRLAGRNAARNPRRTAASATALLVGTTVAALFTTVGASITASIADTVDRTFGGDLVVEPNSFSGAGLSPELAPAVEALAEVETAVSASLAAALVDGRDVMPIATDPSRLAAIVDLGVVSGNLIEMMPGQFAVSGREAERRGWAIGTEVPVTFADGVDRPTTLAAIYTERDMFGDVLLHASDWAPHARGAGDVVMLIELADGIGAAAGAAAVTEVGAAFGAPAPQTRDQFVDSIAGEINVLLGVVYGLLGLAVLIALMGLANTLSLSIHERTRELGILRAVGQSRAQLRSTVRWESVLTAVFGAVAGVALGLVLAWGLIRAVAVQEEFGIFAAPLGTLALIVVVAAVAGVVAAILPARRAARIDVLTAVAGE
jgi:putative ABC transport system permease protein